VKLFGGLLVPAIKAEYLKSIVSNIFTSVGTPRDEVDVLAKHLVKANLYGHDSHGVIRIPYYL
jgi:uncharacterized oxidoreductase